MSTGLEQTKARLSGLSCGTGSGALMGRDVNVMRVKVGYHTVHVRVMRRVCEIEGAGYEVVGFWWSCRRSRGISVPETELSMRTLLHRYIMQTWPGAGSQVT